MASGALPSSPAPGRKRRNPLVSFVAGTAGACLLIAAGSAFAAANPVLIPSKLDPEWRAKAREFLKEAVEIPSVVGRGNVPRVARLVADQLKGGGFEGSAMRIIPYEGLAGDSTAAFLFRWKSDHPREKPMMVIGHMDVVEAKAEDWGSDPFRLVERGGYFYGRGTLDMKGGIVATTLSLVKLRKSGFTPDRDIILYFTGDEETKQNGALKGSTELLTAGLTDAEFALNSDGGTGSYRPDGSPISFAVTSSEKTYQTYFLTARNRGGHSSQPRADNAIFDIADAIKKLQAYRFKPTLNPTTRAYFEERQKHDSGALGDAMRRWLKDEGDVQAADLIEASPGEVGRTRTNCTPTMLAGGHADNALPQMARVVVNCRIMPGVQPAEVQTGLQRLVGPAIEIVPDPDFLGQATPASPLRADLMAAFTKAVRALHQDGIPIMPAMEVGTSDASFFRAAGIPTYNVDGAWSISPDDDRAHGRDERIPARALYDDILHWEIMIRALAGG